MARRRRKEARWPLLVLASVLGAGLGLGSLLTGSSGRDASRESDLDDRTALDVAVPTLENRVRVEVLNGGGVPGVAARATDLLRDHGFDVVFFGNETSFGRDSSVILDRTRREGVLDSVSGSLGIGSVRVEPDSAVLVDITVLLGTDWKPDEEVAEGAAQPLGVGETNGTARPWWDVRRLLEGGR